MSDYKVLIPLDGSRLAERALAFVPALRKLGDCQIRLLSVVDESEDFKELTAPEGSEREFNVLSTYLREVTSDLSKHLGVKAEAGVKRGKPATCIMEEAHSFAPDLLVISTHGRSGLSRWRFGSVADKLIRASESNTLVIGPKAADQGKWLEADLVPAFESILVPLDGSGAAEQALPVARRFADAYHSDVHLVRAVPIPTMADGMGAEVAYVPDLLGDLVSAAKAYMPDAVKRGGFQGAVNTDVVVGSAAFQLQDYIKTHSIDLVVMTSHGRGGVFRAALGSVTDRLLGGAAPVLVVRNREAP